MALQGTAQRARPELRIVADVSQPVPSIATTDTVFADLSDEEEDEYDAAAAAVEAAEEALEESLQDLLDAYSAQASDILFDD